VALLGGPKLNSVDAASHPLAAIGGVERVDGEARISLEPLEQVAGTPGARGRSVEGRGRNRWPAMWLEEEGRSVSGRAREVAHPHDRAGSDCLIFLPPWSTGRCAAKRGERLAAV